MKSPCNCPWEILPARPCGVLLHVCTDWAQAYSKGCLCRFLGRLWIVSSSQGLGPRNSSSSFSLSDGLGLFKANGLPFSAPRQFFPKPPSGSCFQEKNVATAALPSFLCISFRNHGHVPYVVLRLKIIASYILSSTYLLVIEAPIASSWLEVEFHPVRFFN